MIDLRGLHVRTRITLWHTAIFGAILTLYAVGATTFLWILTDRQIDTTLKEELEVLQHFLDDLPSDDHLDNLHAQQSDRFERLVEVWTPDGRLVLRNRPFTTLSLGPPPRSLDSPGRYTVQRITATDGTRWRMVRTTHSVRGSRHEVRLAISEEPYLEEIRSFAVVLACGMPLALVFVVGTGMWFARRTLRPIEIMATTAGRIGAETLTDRIPVTNPRDEFGTLAATLNHLLDRLQEAFDRLRRFTGDASHELRTPLTAMRAVGEVGLQTRHSARGYQDVIGSMLEENARLTDLVDRLLMLSRADAGRYPLRRETLAMDAFLHSVTETVQVLADEKGQTLATSCRCTEPVLLDRHLSRQALINIIDNAIKYSPRESTIDIHAGVERGVCTIEVRDRGPGIPEDQRERVFERFVRLDQHRSRTAGGAGLGLSIARWAVEAQGGSLRAGPHPGGGTIFTMSFPS